MACLIMEILMLLTGLFVIIRPNLQLTDRINLQGRRARIVGLFWIAPLPTAFMLGILLGALGLSPDDNMLILCLEPLLVLGAFVGSVIYARSSG